MSVPDTVGPILFARGGDTLRMRFAALLVTSSPEAPQLVPAGGEAVDASQIDVLCGRHVWRYDFELAVAQDSHYLCAGERYAVLTDWHGDARIAYVSCNGQESDDPHWSREQRNALWHRLANEHRNRPFALMLHGGDQLYADEMLNVHPAIRDWRCAEPAQRPAFAFTEDARAAAEQYLIDLYLHLYSEPDYAYLSPRVPSLMMWDDHDIMDGWGSYPENLLESPVGRGLFGISRRLFMLFQLARAPDEDALDQSQGNAQRLSPAKLPAALTHATNFPGFTVVAPDLRSERRPWQIMGECGWRQLESFFSELEADRQLLFMSSVPLLGPRLSWIERMVPLIPALRRYADDLRDQWQSRAHRAEWQRMLRLLGHFANRQHSPIIVLSGEIHLATYGEMPLDGGALLHQFVASGIAHPAPPRLYARALGWLASLGEGPLPGKRIRLLALPGQRRIYTAERNYLVLEGSPKRWKVAWELEHSGRTAPLTVN